MPVASTAQRKACRTYYIKNKDRLKEASNTYYAEHKIEMLRKKKLKYQATRAARTNSV